MQNTKHKVQKISLLCRELETELLLAAKRASLAYGSTSSQSERSASQNSSDLSWNKNPSRQNTLSSSCNFLLGNVGGKSRTNTLQVETWLGTRHNSQNSSDLSWSIKSKSINYLVYKMYFFGQKFGGQREQKLQVETWLGTRHNSVRAVQPRSKRNSRACRPPSISGTAFASNLIFWANRLLFSF